MTQLPRAVLLFSNVTRKGILAFPSPCVAGSDYKRQFYPMMCKKSAGEPLGKLLISNKRADATHAVPSPFFPH